MTIVESLALRVFGGGRGCQSGWKVERYSIATTEAAIGDPLGDDEHHCVNFAHALHDKAQHMLEVLRIDLVELPGHVFKALRGLVLTVCRRELIVSRISDVFLPSPDNDARIQQAGTYLLYFVANFNPQKLVVTSRVPAFGIDDGMELLHHPVECAAGVGAEFGIGNEAVLKHHVTKKVMGVTGPFVACPGGY